MNYSYSYIEELTKDLLVKNNLFYPKFDIKKLVKKLDINLLYKELGEDVSGLFVMSGEKGIISVNKNESNNKTRQRFTIAHEIGHFLLHSKLKPIFIDKSPKVMFRNSESSSGELHQEREANAFAAALLMPRDLINDELEKLESDFDNPTKKLAKIFNVSEQAMSFRLANLGYELGLF